MKLPIFIAALALLIAQAPPPKETIEGRVVRPLTHEPIADVLVTLTVPATPNNTTNLAPDVAARLNDQIASLTQTGATAGVSQQVIDNAIENVRRNAGATAGQQRTVFTDISGRFSFKDLTPGRYTLRAEREGYFAPPANGTASTQVNRTIVVQEGKPPAEEELLMVKGSVISGRVRDPNGQPISGMTVAVYRVNYNNGKKLWSSANSKATDDRGEFRIFWFYPGEYYVGVTPRTPGTVPGPQDTWLRTFFPGVADPAEATAIELKDGSESLPVEITIRTANIPTFKISGVVVNSTARPNPTTGAVDRSIASFILAPRDPGVLDSQVSSATNALPTASRQNGEFELRNIRAGSYDLYPVAPVLTDPVPSAPATTLGGITTSVQVINGQTVTSSSAVPVTRRQPTSRNPIEVNRDLADLRIVVNGGVPLTGEVVVNGTATAAIRREQIRLTLRILDTMPTTFVSQIGTIPVDASGKFSTSGIPEARYTFQVSGIPNTAYVADIRQGGSSVMDNGFVLDASASPVQVVIEASGAMLQGTVQNAEGKPAAAVTVVLVPPVDRRQSTLLYRNTTTDDTGKFTLRGIPPGAYTVYAWESVVPTAWQNAEFLQKYDGRGRTVNINATAASEIQLNAIR